MSDSDEPDTYSKVLDNGSHRIKAGFSGDDSPRAVFPTVVGRQMLGGDGYFIGDGAVSRLATLTFSRPIENGLVTNWDDMENVWRFMFNHELRMQPENQPIFVTENALNPLSNRENMAENISLELRLRPTKRIYRLLDCSVSWNLRSLMVLFEHFNVPSCAVMTSALPGLVASGRTAALVVDAGCDVTTITPLYDCHVMKDGIRKMNVGGSHVTDRLGKLLSQRGYSFFSAAEMWALDEMKRYVCYVTPDPCDVTSSSTYSPKEYQMSQGDSVIVTKERYMAPECLFQPSLVDNPCPGIALLVHESIQSCDVSVRKELYGNIILAGASTMFPGIVERLKKDVQELVPVGTVVKVIAPPERKSSVWIGGSILTSLSFGQTMWVTKHQYQESGSVLLHTDWEPPPGLGDMCT